MSIKKIKKCVIVSALCASLAHAEFMDGNKLLTDMNGSQMRQMAVIGYVMGVADSLHGVSSCPPASATAGQVHDMVKQYLEDNPSLRHHTGDVIVGRVLMRAWPCKQPQQRGTSL
jgi:hypothetical protein